MSALRLTIFSILALCISPISLAQTDQPNSCEQALLTNLKNYASILQFGIASQAFTVEDLTRLSANQLNPLESGLKAPQRLLKAAIDKIILKFNAEERQEALILVQRLLNEHSLRLGVKQEAQVETSRILNPKVISDIAIPMTQFERKEGIRTLRLDSSNGQNLLAAFKGHPLSYKLLDLNAADPQNQILDEQPAPNSHLTIENSSLINIDGKDGADQILAAWIGRQEVHFHNYSLKKTSSLTMDLPPDARLILSRNSKSEVFFAITTQNGWKIGQLGSNGPELTGEIPKLMADTAVAKGTSRYAPGLAYTGTGEPRYFGIRDDGVVEIRDGRTSQLLQKWQGPQQSARRVRRVMLPTFVDDKLALAFHYTTWNATKDEPIHLLFFQEGDPKVYRSTTLKGNVETLKWLEHSTQPSFAVFNNGYIDFLQPFLKTTRLGLGSRFRNLLSHFSFRNGVQTSSGTVPTKKMEECVQTAVTDLRANGKHLWICAGWNELYVIELGPNLEILDHYSREIPVHGQRPAFFVDEATQEILVAIASGPESVGIYTVRKDGPILVHDVHGVMLGGFYRLKHQAQDSVLINTGVFDADQFRIQTLQVIGAK